MTDDEENPDLEEEQDAVDSNSEEETEEQLDQPDVKETQLESEEDEVAREIEELLTQGEDASRNNDIKGALSAFNKAIALDPSCDMAWFNRGVLLEA